MIKRLFVLLATLVGTLSLWAQTPRQVLDQTASVLSSYPSSTVKFQASLGKKGNTSGTLTVQGRKFHLNTPEALAWFDGKTLWTLMRSSNEVNVTTPSAAEIQSMNPYYFINLYKKDYDLSMKPEGNKRVVTLSAQKRQSIQTMVITVDSRTSLPSKVVMTSPRGTVTTINISNIKGGKKMADSAFTFNPKDYPKAQIIDLR